MTYTKKFTTVQAYQWDGNSYYDISQLDHVESCFNSEPILSVMTANAVYRMCPGDWLLVDGEDMKVLSDTQFKRQYK